MATKETWSQKVWRASCDTNIKPEIVQEYINETIHGGFPKCRKIENIRRDLLLYAEIASQPVTSPVKKSL